MKPLPSVFRSASMFSNETLPSTTFALPPAWYSVIPLDQEWAVLLPL